MKQKLQYVVIHCTATPEGRNVTADTVRRWHTSAPPNGRGWTRVGYSDLILLDGTRHRFVKHNGDEWVDVNEITNGASGINSISRHVCYVGGLDANTKHAKDTLTDIQNITLSSIIAEVLAYAPTVIIAGHNQFANKACPSFYVPTYLRERCLTRVHDINIYKKNPYNYKTNG